MTDDERDSLSYTIEQNVKGEVSSKAVLKKSITVNSIWWLIIWCLGLTVFGKMIIPLYMCYKGYCLGITLGFVFTDYGAKGFLINSLCVLPHYTLFLAATVFSALVGISYFGKNQKYEKRDFITYLLCGGATEAAILLASLVEAYSSARLVIFFLK